MSDMHFLNPSVLWLLAVIPPLGAVAVWLAWRRKQQLLEWFGQESLWSKYSQPLSAGRSQWKGLCVFVALAAAIVALARPSFEKGSVEFPRGTIDIVALVDESRSMAVPDYAGQVKGYYYGGGTRLDMAKYLILNDVVASLHGNRLGIVTFSGEAFPQAFITDDMPAMNWVLRRAITIGGAPGEGSALAKSFGLAFQLFDLDSDPDHRKIIVLFSDGGNDDDAARLDQVLSECRKRGIEVIVAGLGKTTDAAIPVKELSPLDRRDMYGKQWYEVNGEVVHNTALDENTLRLIANKTGGRYVRVRSSSDFHIGSLVSRTEVTYHKGEQEVFYYPLIIAALFLVLAMVSPMETVPVTPVQDKAERSKPGRTR
jgi:Ca-activated chloride channel family protein